MVLLLVRSFFHYTVNLTQVLLQEQRSLTANRDKFIVQRENVEQGAQNKNNQNKSSLLTKGKRGNKTSLLRKGKNNNYN